MSEQNIFDLYKRLGLSVFSFDLSFDNATNKKKAIYPNGDWHNAPCESGKTGYGLMTGKDYGCSAIDIDDVTLPHNVKLYEILLESSNLVAKTRKGYHFVFEYRASLKNCQPPGYQLDIRNNGGHLYVEPATYVVNGQHIAYKWIKTPTGNHLNAIPNAALELLAELDYDAYFRTNEEQAIEYGVTAATEEEPDGPDEVATPPDAELLWKVLDSLKQSRIDSYDGWLKIGMIIKNEGLSFDVYDNLSKKSKFYNKKEALDKWRSFKSRGSHILTQASLWRMLKEDDIDAFHTLQASRQDLDNIFKLLNHKDVAKYFYNCHPDKYLWNENIGWFVLQPNNVWRQSEKHVPSGLKLSISNTLHDAVTNHMTLKQDQFKVAKKNADDDTRTKLISEEKKFLTFINGVYKTLGSSEFVNGIISFLSSYYDVADLDKIIDTNRYLFAFENCVYDLQTGKKRNIMPTDYIATTTGYPHPAKSNARPNAKADLMAFLHGLFENEETLDYFLKVLAFSCLGYNRFEEYYCWVGSGSNGKGVVDQLLKHVFGNYYQSVDMSLFTQRTDGKDKPIPALVDARNKRVMVSTEPESDEALQVGFLKKVTGGDSIEARTLYSKNIVSYKPQFTIMLQMNNPPKLSKIDQGIERRTRIIPFPFKFLPQHKMTDTSIHRLGDPDVKDKKCQSTEWRDEMILILLEIYIKNKDLKSLLMPPQVVTATAEYLGDNNKVGSWLQQHYTRTDSEDDTISAKMLKDEYMKDTKTDKLSDKWFKEMLQFNGLNGIKRNTGILYVKLKRNSDFIGE